MVSSEPCSRDIVWSQKSLFFGSIQAYASAGAYTSQYVINDTGYDSFQEENIPQGELAVYSSMHVETSDGKVGKLDKLVLDPKSGDITHLQMREGHLCGEKDVAILVSAVVFLTRIQSIPSSRKKLSKRCQPYP